MTSTTEQVSDCLIKREAVEMAMSNITYKPHCNYAKMTSAHNYAQCCDGVGGEKAWSTLAASASGGETVGCVVLLHWATLG